MGYNISYDGEADVITVMLPKDGRITDAEMVGDILVHWNDEGEPVLLEFLNASKLIPKMVEALARREVVVAAL